MFVNQHNKRQSMFASAEQAPVSDRFRDFVTIEENRSNLLFGPNQPSHHVKAISIRLQVDELGFSGLVLLWYRP